MEKERIKTATTIKQMEGQTHRQGMEETQSLRMRRQFLRIYQLYVQQSRLTERMGEMLWSMQQLLREAKKR